MVMRVVNTVGKLSYDLDEIKQRCPEGRTFKVERIGAVLRFGGFYDERWLLLKYTEFKGVHYVVFVHDTDNERWRRVIPLCQFVDDVNRKNGIFEAVRYETFDDGDSDIS